MIRIGLALLVLWAGAALAADPGAALKARQAEAQKQQSQLRERIGALQKDIEEQERSRKDAAVALRESESAISAVSRRLDELDAGKRKAEGELKRLEGQIAEQKQVLAQRQSELAGQLRAQYASGLSPWTALLSGDDPQAIGRELGYLSYVSQAQAEAVRAVRAALDRLASLQEDARTRRQELVRLADETGKRKQELQEQQEERRRVLARISGELRRQRARAETMQRDEQRLGKLVTGLEAEIARQAEQARLAEERRKAEEARREAEARRREIERQRQAALAAQKAARQAQARAQRERDEQAARQARQQVERARAQARAAEQAAREQPAPPPARVEPEPPGGAMQGLRKGMAYPVQGEVQGRFGMERPEGGIWRGIVLRADEGTPVRAIAPGRVVYANWLNGFGNLIIVDHGAKYLSVYGYNQSLLKQVGQMVDAGEAIATVGATGGQVESGLYFEIRHNGAPVNPLLWLAR